MAPGPETAQASAGSINEFPPRLVPVEAEHVSALSGRDRALVRPSAPCIPHHALVPPIRSDPSGYG